MGCLLWKNSLFSLLAAIKKKSDEGVTHPTQPGRNWDKYSKDPIVLEMEVEMQVMVLQGSNRLRFPTPHPLWLCFAFPKPKEFRRKTSRGERRGMDPHVPNPGGNAHPEKCPLQLCRAPLFPRSCLSLMRAACPRPHAGDSATGPVP